MLLPLVIKVASHTLAGNVSEKSGMQVSRQVEHPLLAAYQPQDAVQARAL
jgi:hypothetical protein